MISAMFHVHPSLFLQITRKANTELGRWKHTNVTNVIIPRTLPVVLIITGNRSISELNSRAMYAVILLQQRDTWKFTRKGNMKTFCDKCDFTVSTKIKLKIHKESKHEGIRYLCDQCSSSYMIHGELKKHKRRVHEGVTFTCDECTFVSSFPESVRRHKITEHALK